MSPEYLAVLHGVVLPPEHPDEEDVRREELRQLRLIPYAQRQAVGPGDLRHRALVALGRPRLEMIARLQEAEARAEEAAWRAHLAELEAANPLGSVSELNWRAGWPVGRAQLAREMLEHPERLEELRRAAQVPTAAPATAPAAGRPGLWDRMRGLIARRGADDLDGPDDDHDLGG